MISPVDVANTVLVQANYFSVPVNLLKLQRTMYLLASEFSKETGGELFAEQFETWKYGPALLSVDTKWSWFKDQPITKLAHHAGEEPKAVILSKHHGLATVFARVWAATWDRSGMELSRLLCAQDSAWDKAFQADRRLIDPKDMAMDRTYCVPLGLCRT
ncbi:hypothetical protein V5R04_06785 [Jonesiaceae bacterium BS-20]|uniref:Antitoxin SocA-like Panacea domain-containing protein n=1 Tax=Jonesiaceae bacterium BS-20 TaxID=3120821 RepID=A0AAU7DZV4_9MICO